MSVTDKTAPLSFETQDWYKDAVIYQLHIKAFSDSTGNGIGDFRGLMQRLDYICDIGATAIWLLPFYPSPLRDDGYDIADYRAINSSYGTMRDFRLFISEAHKRGLKVITELVINHTSDQHPWFQRARAAKPGSARRDYYVWSDTNQKYQGTRIIFVDTEVSNWTWDPVAKAYFWHRFYSHQPDLNFDNPQVLNEVIRILHYWLEMGVDGLRLDAVPYLVEREGTNNENLPESHAVLKRIRAEVDAHFPGRMLLAEANQWPEDTRPYFGDGDECHMAFHFPLMPRIYMALAQEDRYPITDILRQTPSIPENCQWAIFLRNHDELTLEMVTESERDYLWSTYAFDKRARINLGIRRRLAPLLENDRRKIELMNGLLLSMPGTPVIYYGDEIGMGDNIFLGDRDGVRTPMQWSADRNGGFSRADPQSLYLPPIMDPIYGYGRINVEAQQKDVSSLLNWMRRMMAVRKAHHAFSRGIHTPLYPGNRKVLAYLRELGDEVLLCVFNLSRSAQAVELDLSSMKSRVPVELTGRSAFPPIGELPYLLTLPAYGFFWFVLAREAALPVWHEPPREPLPEFLTLVINKNAGGVLEPANLRGLEREALPLFLQNQRWFANKGAVISSIILKPWGEWKGVTPATYLAEVRVDSEGKEYSYFLPLSVVWGEDQVSPGAPGLPHVLAKVRGNANVGGLVDALCDDSFARHMLSLMRQTDADSSPPPGLRVERTPELSAIQDLDDPSVRRIGGEQSNVSLILAEKTVLKIYRRIQAGEQPEIEMARFLTRDAEFPNTPRYLGLVEHIESGGEATAIAALFEFVASRGDGWTVLIDELLRVLDEQNWKDSSPDDDERFAQSYALIDRLGQRTAELHWALGKDTTNPAFAKEPLTQDDIAADAAQIARETKAAFSALSRARASLDESLWPEADAMLENQEAILSSIGHLGRTPPSGMKTRLHGDYHLGQVLVVGNDIFIIDFEGEPQRSFMERRRKNSPLRDVAGMIRSIDYVAWAALDAEHIRNPVLTPEDEQLMMRWRDGAIKAFVDSYTTHILGCPSWPSDTDAAAQLLKMFLLEKVFYEISYEAANRPQWISIPLRGAHRLLGTLEKEL